MAPTFEEYLERLSRLTETTDPTLPTAASVAIRDAAEGLATLANVDRATLAAAIAEHPDWVPVLALVVGLSQEKLQNALRHRLGTGGWVTVARTRADDVVAMLDDDYELVRLLEAQRTKTYDFGDVLVARAGTKVTAAGGANAGRRLEDAIEEVAMRLGLPHQLRTRFEGRNGRTAPCDLAIPVGGADALIVVAAKAFDSTGSKLTDAVREVEEMADVRLPRQYVMAAVDGIGWLSRQADLRRIHRLAEQSQIDGLYTLTMLDEFAADLENAARLRGLL